MKTTDARPEAPAFTLVEWLVVIAMVAIAIFVALPVFTSKATKGPQTKALSNAKGIALALRLYASDHNDNYPSFTLRNGKPTTTPVADSNTAFAQLFPAYINVESVFWLKNSAFCSPAPPDDVADKTPLDAPVKTLEPGENEWAYVLGLNDSSNPSVPLIVSGFYNPVTHTYSTDPAQKGGVWKGQKAIIVHADSSGVVAMVDPATLKVLGPNGAPTPGDIFTTANASNGWLQPANTVVNPK